MEIYRNKNSGVVQENARERLRALFELYKDIPILFLSSGGSAISLLNGLEIKKDCTVSVLDERFEGESNFAAFPEMDCAVIDPRPVKEEGIELTSKRFDNALHKWKEHNSDGIIIATMGIGKDGHTAGIMPYPGNPELFLSLFENKEKWVVGYDAKEKSKYPLRITVTFPFLRIVDYAVVYAVGKEKHDAVNEVLKEQGKLFKTPARIVQEMKHVFFYTNIVL